jgi:hypothetical protein
MPDARDPLLAWPALAGLPSDLPYLVVGHGVWGKAHGATSDFRWLAASPALDALPPGLERELVLGSEDVPDPGGTLWRQVGDVCCAATFYPSRAADAAGRTGFLEKQVLAWRRPPDVPAALGALLLLPAVAACDDSVWWAERSGVRWTSAEAALDLADVRAPSGRDRLLQTIDQGLAELRRAVPEDALVELYAALLAGGRAVPLAGLDRPLSPAALAALLLPLPRDRADALSVLGWLPSRRFEEAELAARWDLVLGSAVPRRPKPVVPSAAERSQAETMVRTLIAAPGSAGISLALWGPTSAGKTVLLAQLFLQQLRTGLTDGEWGLYPTQGSIGFIQAMQDRIRTENLFPIPTGVGQTEKIEYSFQGRGVTASLEVEDRSGKDFEELRDDTRERLAAARGLLLFFDPQSETVKLETSLSNTLAQIYLDRPETIGRDPRPVAVCLSKADLLVESAADLARAIEAPDDFVRSYIERNLLGSLDHYCANYRLFPVSAAGVRLRYGTLEPVVFYDEDLGPRLSPGGEPFNLMRPFTWLLDQIAGGPAR